MALISLAGIAQAIDNLHLNETTLKARFLRAINRRFVDEESLDTLTAIPPLDLIHELWNPQGASEIKAKRKNLSSLKSSINKSLKEGIESNANPDGIIIGRDNVFIIADEKKNLLLDKLVQAGGDSSSLLSALSTLNEMLTGTAAPPDPNEALKILGQLDATRQILTRLAGLTEKEDEKSASPSPQEDEPQPVEELELDADTVIEFIEEEGSGDEAEIPASAGDDPASAQGAVGEAEDGDREEAAAEGASGPGGDASAADWDSFEVMDDDFDVVELEEELEEDLTAAAPQQQAEEEIPAPAGDGPAASAQSAVDEADEGAIEKVAAGEGSGPGGDSSAADWDSFEVLADDDFDLVELDEVPSPLAEEEPGAASETTGVEDMEGADHLLPPATELETRKEEEIPAPAGEGQAAAQGGVGAAEDGDLEEVAAGGGSNPRGDSSAADWDSFEVMDDDFDVVELDEVPSPPEEKEPGAASEATGVEDMEGADHLLPPATELEPRMEEEIPAPAGDGPASVQGGVGEAAEGDHKEVEAGGSSDPAGDSSPADWDSFEVMENDDFDVAELEEELAATTPQQQAEEEISAQDAVGEAGDYDLEEVELEEDFEEPASLEPAALVPEAGSAGGLGLEEEEAGGGGDPEGDSSPADWDSFEVMDDDDDFEIREPADLSGQRDDKGGREEMAAPGPEGPKPALTQSMDLSQYIEAEEALDNNPNILQEQNDAYVRQILARFMPKFIKIPAGSYPVGGPKKRQTDRPTDRVVLPQFYIGQLPITNDLFDFFVRETGYQTEAEQQGYGLVTSGRLCSGVQQKTGRHTLTINQGVISRPLKGANWRHPDGPGSSLDNRGQHPVVQVSRLDALAFAAWAGKRLPSEDEWEAAARGRAGLLFPWGNTFLPLANLAAHQRGSTTPVNYFGRQSLSPFGLLDMLGNTFEWTASNHKSPRGRQLAILKGGSWASAQISCAHRLIEPAATWSNTIGFRCAVDGDEGQSDHKSR